MSKLIIVGCLALFAVSLYGLDWFLEMRQLTWSAIFGVWPFWLLSMVAGVGVGGLIFGAAAEYSYKRDSAENAKKQSAQLEQYKQDYTDRLASREATLEEIRADNDKQHTKNQMRARELEEAIAQADERHADAQRIIIEAQLDVEDSSKRAFNATKTVERLRNKITKLEDALAEIEQEPENHEKVANV